MSDVATVVDALEDQLRALVADALAQEVEIVELRQLTGGASRQTWSFDAITQDGDVRPLILRRDPPEAPGSGMSVEAHAIVAARRRGVPEPEIVAYGDDKETLGAPFIVMERVVGETLAPRILRDQTFSDVRPLLAEQCGEILARIHSIPVVEVPGLAHPDVLADLQEQIHSFDDPSPALELGLRWLEER